MLIKLLIVLLRDPNINMVHLCEVSLQHTNAISVVAISSIEVRRVAYNMSDIFGQTSLAKGFWLIIR